MFILFPHVCRTSTRHVTKTSKFFFRMHGRSMQSVIVCWAYVTSVEASRAARVRDVRRLLRCTCGRATTRRERRWNRNLARCAGGGRLSHLDGCVVERARVCHSASAHVPHDRRPSLHADNDRSHSCARMPRPTGTVQVPRVCWRWSTCLAWILQKFVIALSRHTVKQGN